MAELNPGRAELTPKSALTEGTWCPSLPPVTTSPKLPAMSASSPYCSSARGCSTSAPPGKRKPLPLGHLMLLKVLFILVSTPFYPDLWVCSLSAYSLFLMLLNNGPKYPLVEHVFIKHLQCIIHFPGYWQQDHCPNSCGSETF